MWGVIKLLKLAVVSKKDVYEKPQIQQQAISFLKKTVERFVELSSACRRKAFWNYRKLTHAKLM